MNLSSLPPLAHVTILLLALLTQTHAAQIRINLGTLAPRGSVYHTALAAMGEKWRQTPAGGVRLVIYPDGTQGGESDMVRLMRVGTLHAGLLTAMGLGEIDHEVTGIQSLPMMFRTLNEFDFVFAKVRPNLEQRIEQKGFVVLFWGDAGWVRFCSKGPLVHPDDLKQKKTFVWAGNQAQVEIMKRLGFNPVPLDTSEILPGLQTGLIDTITVPPIFALRNQMEQRTPYMLELNWAPLLGAAVIKKETWDKIPAQTKPALLQAAEEAGKTIQTQGRKENTDSVTAMKKRGLKLHSVSPELDEEWRTAAERVYPQIRGTLVPPALFDRVRELLKEYRSNPASPQR